MLQVGQQRGSLIDEVGDGFLEATPSWNFSVRIERKGLFEQALENWP